jgi:hypothetical protein
MVDNVAADSCFKGKVIHPEVLIIQVGENDFSEFVYKCLILGEGFGHDSCFDPLNLQNIIT